MLAVAELPALSVAFTVTVCVPSLSADTSSVFGLVSSEKLPESTCSSYLARPLAAQLAEKVSSTLLALVQLDGSAAMVTSVGAVLSR